MHAETDDTPEPGSSEPAAPSGSASAAAGEASGAGPSDPLLEARAEAAKMKEAWLRTAADFDNYRKRARKELDEARRGGREDLLRALLPVFDNLERAIQSAQRSSDVKGVSDGLAMVLRQFVEALAREGIVRVATVGQPFDPGVHEAIQQVESAEHAPGTILAEVQAGYTQNDRLVRAAMVVVARAKVGSAAPPAPDGAEPGSG